MLLQVIPSALAYGDEGFGDVIPPAATLVFQVGTAEKRVFVLKIIFKFISDILMNTDI